MTRKIEWADETINPIVGCSPISEGCANCYARRMAGRLSGNPATPQYKDVAQWDGTVKFVPQALKYIPGKGKRVFVCSMSDMFHENVAFRTIDRIMAFIAGNPHHTFLVLTKRVKRMHEYFCEYPSMGDDGNIVNDMCCEFPDETWKAYPEAGAPICEDTCDGSAGPIVCPDSPDVEFPLKNLCLGVTVENQKAANERIPYLIKTPAVYRFVSVEPMLERMWIPCIKKLDQIICGAETGPGKRQMRHAWAEDLYRQCREAGVAFFGKKDSTGNPLKVGSKVVREI